MKRNGGKLKVIFQINNEKIEILFLIISLKLIQAITFFKITFIFFLSLFVFLSKNRANI